MTMYFLKELKKLIPQCIIKGAIDLQPEVSFMYLLIWNNKNIKCNQCSAVLSAVGVTKLTITKCFMDVPKIQVLLLHTFWHLLCLIFLPNNDSSISTIPRSFESWAYCKHIPWTHFSQNMLNQPQCGCTTPQTLWKFSST